MTSLKALAKSGAALRALTLVTTVAVGLSGCSTLAKLNSFGKTTNKSVAAQGERIPVLPETDQLQPAAALRGQDFFIPGPQPIKDWPVPGGTPEQSVENVAAGANLTIAWRKGLGVAGLNRQHYVTAPPVEADGKVFAMDGQAHVSAHEADSGRQLWTTNLQSKDRRDRDGYGGGLAYANGRIFVTSGYRLVTALDANTGKVIWQVKTDEPIHSAPNVSEGRVFAVTLDDQLLAFNTTNGQQIWNYQAIIEPARILMASSPAISGNTIVTGFGSGELIAQGAANGNDLWTQALSQSNRNNALSEIRDIAGRPVIYRGDVFAISHSGMFSAVDLRTGAPRWSLPVAGQMTPLPVGDVVYIVSESGQLICVARESGQVYWQQDLNAPPPITTTRRGKPRRAKKVKKAYWAGPILASNQLILVSSNGDLEARDPHTGAVEKIIKLGSPAMQSPIAAGSMLYVVTEKAELIAIR
jgi:outer membrane protein assembly factor BamB